MTQNEMPEMGDTMEKIETLVTAKLIKAIENDYDSGVDRYGKLLIDLLNTKATLMTAYNHN
jgi:hypothetical protein